MKRLLIPTFLSVLGITSFIGTKVLAADKQTVAIPNVKTGDAMLTQEGRLTVLEVKPRTGARHRIALSHPSDYRQGTNAPYEAKLIAEAPGHFLIFTDRFESNPANVQGHCGASDGERFLHVIALDTIPHETLSVLVESCLLNLEPTSNSPEWIEKGDSAGFVGRIVITFTGGSSSSLTYYVAPDGSVTRPFRVAH